MILAGLALLGSIELSAYTYEVSPLVGKNFTEDNSLVQDSTAMGIRLNKFISEDNAIMFGYTRINSADYKRNALKKGKGLRTSGCDIDPCAKPKPCPAPNCTPQANSGNTSGQNSNNSANNTSSGNSTSSTNGGNNTGNTSSTNNSGSNTGNTNGNTGATNNNENSTGNTSGGTNTGNTNGNSGGTTIPTPGTGLGNLGTALSSDTDINRFYINGMHQIKTKYSRLVPYVYGGFGYEHVENELAENESQGFFNAGGGLKFRINDRLSLVSDIQGVKKFRSHDLDILGSLGIGYLFGNFTQPEPEALVASGLEDVEPTAPAKQEVTIVKVAPQAAVAAPILKATPKGEYYIQMAAGFKTDMETGCKHTRDLRKAGIHYDIKYTTIKGKNAALVVVGPYATKKEAASHLPELRKYSKDAFVKRIKG